MKKLSLKKMLVAKLTDNELGTLKGGNQVASCLGRACKNSEWLICIKDSLL